METTSGKPLMKICMMHPELFGSFSIDGREVPMQEGESTQSFESEVMRRGFMLTHGLCGHPDCEKEFRAKMEAP